MSTSPGVIGGRIHLIAYVAMIFLNGFVDLGHKIIIQNTLFKAYDGDTQILLTAIINAIV